MPEYLTPGVYVEETSFRARSIEGVATSTVGMTGFTRYGPVPHVLSVTDAPGGQTQTFPVVREPPMIGSFSEFERAFGGLADVADERNYTALAARAFFENGGQRLYMARVFGWPRAGDAIDQAQVDGFFARRAVNANGTPIAQWRARWPGAAAGDFEIEVGFRRSKNVIVPPPDAAGDTPRRLTAVREFSLVELAAEEDRLSDTTRPDPANVRVVIRDGNDGQLKLEGDNGPVALPADQVGYHIQLQVTVRWGDRNDVYTELAVDRRHPRSILRVLEQVDPADEFGLVWLREIGTPTPQQLISALLAPENQGFLSGGRDGEQITDRAIRGDEADPDDLDSPTTGLFALGEVEDIAIVMVPDTARLDGEFNRAAVQEVITHCENERYRIAIVDPPRDSSISDVREFRAQFDTKYAALYYPWVEIIDPTVFAEPGAPPPKIFVPPSGYVAGIYARNDIERGVFKAPANEVVRGIVRFQTNVTFNRQAVLNPEGINALRFFEGRANRVWGARTMSSDPEWKYVNVRRLFIYLEASIDRSTQWVVFEPNNERLWASIRQTIEDFLIAVWRTGALMGTRPEEAFFVRCDRTTMSQNDLDNGRLIVLIGIAPTYPAEFVIFRIGQWTADANRS